MVFSFCILSYTDDDLRSGSKLLYYYSGPSSYDRLDIRTTWVTTKNYSFDLRPKSSVTTRMPVKASGRNSGQCIALYNYFR
jgi:hypothetical protein